MLVIVSRIVNSRNRSRSFPQPTTAPRESLYLEGVYRVVPVCPFIPLGPYPFCFHRVYFPPPPPQPPNPFCLWIYKDGYGAGDNDLFAHHVLPPPSVKWQTFRFVNSHNRPRPFYSQQVPPGKPFSRRSLSGCSPSVRLFMKAKPYVSSKSPALFLNKYVLKKITIYFIRLTNCTICNLIAVSLKSTRIASLF